MTTVRFGKIMDGGAARCVESIERMRALESAKRASSRLRFWATVPGMAAVVDIGCGTRLTK